MFHVGTTRSRLCPLHSLFPENREYADVVHQIKCVERVALARKKPLEDVLMVLDCSFAQGLAYSYRSLVLQKTVRYVERNGIIVELSSDGEKSELHEETDEMKKYAELVVRQMAVSATGIRPGELMRGTDCTSKGALLEVVKGNLPASTKDLCIVRMFEELWREFLNKLSAYPYFYHRTLPERSLWFAGHHGKISGGEFSWGDHHLHEVGNAKVRLLGSG